MAEQFNQWGTVTFEVPDFLESTRDKINTTAEFLVAVLDIALTALDFVKTFLVGYLDPIAAIVHAIVQEVRSLISDLRQLGEKRNNFKPHPNPLLVKERGKYFVGGVLLLK